MTHPAVSADDRLRQPAAGGCGSVFFALLQGAARPAAASRRGGHIGCRMDTYRLFACLFRPGKSGFFAPFGGGVRLAFLRIIARFDALLRII